MTSAYVVALQNALDGEHRAVYGYGLVGGRLSGDEMLAALNAYNVHEIRRDVLIRTLRDLGATTPPAQPAYLPPAPVRTPPQARALAVHIEDACVAAYATILSAGDSTARVRTIGWLEDSAVRAMRWRLNLGPSSIAAAPPLPGLATPNP